MLIAFPVLPLLASTIVSPGFNRPSSSARSIMYFAMRALIEPDGFMYSILTQMPSIFIKGVLPMASRIVFIDMAFHIVELLARALSDDIN